MNGAESLVQSLLAAGIDTCFANPGTSEMHFVSALDRHPGMRCVLGLFEGVVTGAADGYGRMMDKPAVTLLHCGPGLTNGMANLHNARRANTPVLNLIGDQATSIVHMDPPLSADTTALANTLSVWTRRSTDPARVATDAMEGVRASMEAPGVASLILPSDAAWGDGGQIAAYLPPAPPTGPTGLAVDRAAQMLTNGKKTVLLLSNRALREGPLKIAGRIAHKTGARLMTLSQIPRLQAGLGRVPIERIPYNVDLSIKALDGVEQIIQIGAREPVNFFAYPGKPNVPMPEGCTCHMVTRPDQDHMAALDAIAEAVKATEDAPLPAAPDHGTLSGAISPEALGAAINQNLPDNAIIVDESVSYGRALLPSFSTAKPHDYLHLNGGSIGLGIPMATGAAVAAPGRRVVALQADGSALYTLQGLWTQAREGLDVTTVILSNRRYAILQGEMTAVGANLGPAAQELFNLDRPATDWQSIAKGFGIPATQAADMESLVDQLNRANATSGPQLIELMI
ncbi:acetolactate synthase large subunit [Thalassovita aquimarina]|uniref:Acetolactate synthase large subunit n=1 Tax=Thalassovita aquimarina TaxID=2785917 RepID=A0ABS5HTY8_9RHOB|nr:acetolactate synthase large subunit [Thalassovita aquimarina]MBR9652252.1 acetolactate synthase large subunit [Thalassovita aquimarina]